MQFVAAMQANGQAPAGPAQQQKFLGVPEGYVAPPGRRFGPQRTGYVKATDPAQPLYTEADIFTPRFTSPEDIARLQAEMARVGLFGKKPRYLNGKWDEKSQVAYEKLLRYANQGGLTDRDALADLAANGGAEGLFVGEQEPFTGSKSQTSRSVNLADPTSARQMLRSTLKDKLGRAPSKAEYEQFYSALTAAQRKNPNVTTSTVSYEEGEATGSSSVSAGGVDAGGFAEEFAQQGAIGEEANTFMVATDYYNAAMQALRSPV